MIRAEAVFKGRVQGVGFRCSAREMAREIGITGWVKNCTDGSVMLLAEGDSGSIDDFVRRLKGCFSIRECVETRTSAEPRFTDFTIQY